MILTEPLRHLLYSRVSRYIPVFLTILVAPVPLHAQAPATDQWPPLVFRTPVEKLAGLTPPHDLLRNGDWGQETNFWKLQGSDRVKQSVTDINGQSFGQARRFEVKPRPDDLRWDIQLDQLVDCPLQKGEPLVLKVWMRSPDNLPVTAYIGDRLNRWAHRPEGTWNVGAQWREYEVRGTATRDFYATEATVGFWLGGAEGAVEIGPVRLLKIKDTSIARNWAALKTRMQSFDDEFYKPGQIVHTDEITLRDGRKLVGKLIEVATQDILINNEGRYVFSRYELERIERKMPPQADQKPDLPDVSVIYIERTPRYRSNHGNVDYKDDLPALKTPNNDPLYPPVGSPVKFIAHVTNAGLRDSRTGKFLWKFDGKIVGEGVLEALAPGEERTVELHRPWQDGEHTITFETPPVGQEVSRRNNSLTDRTDAFPLIMAVVGDERNRILNSRRNIVDSYCFDDWQQWEIQVMNEAFAQSIWPDMPGGAHARVRLDKLLVVPDARDLDALQRDGHDSGVYYEGRWTHRWDLKELPKILINTDWGLPHELGHQLGLIDEYSMFTELEHRKIVDNGRMANIKNDYSRRETMMSFHGPHPFSQGAALALGLQRGKHRGFFGDYLYAMPKQTLIRVLDKEGNPAAGVQLSFYQSKRSVMRDLAFSGRTDADGRFILPNRETPEVDTDPGFHLRANPFAHTDVGGNNGLFAIKMEKNGQSEWNWMEIIEPNLVAYTGGNEYLREYRTHFAPQGALDAPKNVRGVYRLNALMRLTYDAVPGAAAYRIFFKMNNRGFEVSPFVPVVTAKDASSFVDLPLRDEPYQLSVAAIDDKGREGRLSEPIYCAPLRGTAAITVAPDGARFIADGHPHTGRLMWMNPDRTVQDWDASLEDGANSNGVAILANGKIVVSSSPAKVLQILNRSGLQEAKVGKEGARNGEFNNPRGLASDDANGIFVADVGNNRVQYLTWQADTLRWKTNITADFNAPEAVAWSKARLAVADTGNKCVVLFEKQGDEWKQIQTLTGWDAPSAVAFSPSGQLAVGDRAKRTVDIFNANGEKVAKFTFGEVSGLAFTPEGKLLVTSQWQQVHEIEAALVDGGPTVMWLDNFDLTHFVSAANNVFRPGRNSYNRELKMNGNIYYRGIGTQALSEMAFQLDGAATRFTADCGVDDESSQRGSVVFEVWVDDVRVANSPVMRSGMKTHHFDVDLTGAKALGLRATDADDGQDEDRANWINAAITIAPDAKTKATILPLR